LLWRALLVGVDRPKISLAQVEVAGQVAESPFARDEPALAFRDCSQAFAQGFIDSLDLSRIGAGILRVDRRVGRVSLGQGSADVLDIDQAALVDIQA
jgi:hypothetical protein